MTELKQDLRDGLDGALSDLRTMRDEIRVKLHLAGMDAKDAWHKLEPQLGDVEKEIEKGGAAISTTLKTTVDELRTSFRKLRDDLTGRGASE